MDEAPIDPEKITTALDTHSPIVEPAPLVADSLLDELRYALDAADESRVLELCADVHYSDLADIFERLGREKRRQLIEILGPDFDPEALTEVEPDVLEDMIDALPDAQVGEALGQLDDDDAIDILEDLSEEDRSRILAEVPEEDRDRLSFGLELPQDAAGRLASNQFVAVPVTWTVGQAIDYLRAARELPSEFYDIYLLEHGFKPVGVIALSRVMRSVRNTKLSDIMSTDVHPIRPNLDQEDMAHEFRHYGLISAPIVNDEGRMIGVVTADDVMHVIDEEAVDDMLKLAGIASDSGFFDSIGKVFRARAPWLFVNLLTAVLASWVIGLFEDQLQTLVALAVLMPIVASMGGNAGTQTLTVAVRAIGMRDLTDKTSRMFVFKEALVGLFVGVSFAVITGFATYLWFQNIKLAGIIAAALVVNLLVAALGGATIPILLDRLRIDPANASGVMLTTVTDVVGFFAFLGLATLLLF